VLGEPADQWGGIQGHTAPAEGGDHQTLPRPEVQADADRKLRVLVEEAVE
jgi:hypothetical protein